MERIYQFSILILTLLISIAGWSKPQLSVSLQSALENKSDEELVTAIVLFKDLEGAPKSDYQSVLKFKKQQVHKNTLIFPMSTNHLIQVQQHWIINGATITAPVSFIKTLQNYEQIKSIELDQEIQLIQPIMKDKKSKNAQYTYGLRKINIPQIRKQLPNLDGQGIRIGVLDTGIDNNHADLNNKTVLWQDFTGVDNKQPEDDWGHGTHVCGTIAGGSSSGKTIGIAPKADLVVGRIFSHKGTSTWSRILTAMEWIADPDGDPNTADHPLVINNSWGGDKPTPQFSWQDNSLCKAVQSWRDLNILPVFSAGNDGNRGLGLPGGCPNAFAVGATDEYDGIANFSSRGPVNWKEGSFVKPDVSAPGVQVYSSVPNNNSYGYKSGTSMSSPHVTGLAALLMQKSPGRSIEEYEQWIINGTLDLGETGKDNQYGEGRIDALKSVNEIE